MRIAVISDVHSNIEALDAVLKHAGSERAIDAIWCAGDIVGYGPDPSAVLDAFRERDVQTVAGNHDLAACGLMEIDEFNPVAAEAVIWTQRRLRSDDVAYLRALPLVLDPSPQAVVVHGSLRQPQWEYLLSAEQAAAQFELQKPLRSVVGHSHLQFWMEERDGASPAIRVAGDGTQLDLAHGRFVLNPGSVGQPRDGDPRAGYMLYDESAATVTWHRVEYDAATTHRKIVEAGLPAYLGSRLLIGR
jgi:predicted phosphodiesterase